MAEQQQPIRRIVCAAIRVASVGIRAKSVEVESHWIHAIPRHDRSQLFASAAFVYATTAFAWP